MGVTFVATFLCLVSLASGVQAAVPSGFTPRDIPAAPRIELWSGYGSVGIFFGLQGSDDYGNAVLTYWSYNDAQGRWQGLLTMDDNNFYLDTFKRDGTPEARLRVPIYKEPGFENPKYDAHKKHWVYFVEGGFVKVWSP